MNFKTINELTVGQIKQGQILYHQYNEQIIKRLTAFNCYQFRNWFKNYLIGNYNLITQNNSFDLKEKELINFIDPFMQAMFDSITSEQTNSLLIFLEQHFITKPVQYSYLMSPLYQYYFYWEQEIISIFLQHLENNSYILNTIYSLPMNIITKKNNSCIVKTNVKSTVRNKIRKCRNTLKDHLTNYLIQSFNLKELDNYINSKISTSFTFNNHNKSFDLPNYVFYDLLLSSIDIFFNNTNNVKKYNWYIQKIMMNTKDIVSLHYSIDYYKRLMLLKNDYKDECLILNSSWNLICDAMNLALQHLIANTLKTYLKEKGFTILSVNNKVINQAIEKHYLKIKPDFVTLKIK